MSKNILLPTDFSDNALSAAIYAVKFYENEPCTFHFLHASRLKTSRISNMSNKLTHVMAENARKDLDQLKATFETDYANKNHSFEVILTTNDLEGSIGAILEKTKIDLIIIGTKGESNTSEILFGSNTVNVIKQVKQCPVLVIPNSFDYVKPEQIAFPSDFNRFYGDELQPLIEVTKLHHSKIRILHINEQDNLSKKQNYNLAMLKAYLEDYPSHVDWMPNFQSKEQTILNFIIEFDINILAMINYKHSFLENLLNEPVIQKMGLHTNIPFLVIPELE